jgi:hypothetical protein
MRMQLDTPEIDDPREAGRVVNHNLLRLATGGKRQRHRTQPIRMVLGRALLIKSLTCSAINKTFQHDGPIANARECARRDRQVVAHQFEF